MAFFLELHHLLSRMPVITIVGPLILMLVAVAALHYLRLTRRLREQFATQQRISFELRKLSTAVEQSPTSIVITNRKGIIEYVNPAFCRLTGYALKDVLGKNPKLLKGCDQPPEYYKEMWDTILAGKEWFGEFHNKRKDGTLFWELASISPIRDESGEITHFVGVKENITERKQLLAHLDRMAYYDKLTSLPNRALFFERLAYIQALSRREGKVFALLFIDLDGFKQVNDSCGHEAGDIVLMGAAERLTGCVRDSDIVARMGGDEFTVILGNLTQRDDAVLVAKKILKVLSQPFLLRGGNSCYVSASIGISLYPDDDLDAEKLVIAADYAMYEAKRQGKNGFRFYQRPDAPVTSSDADADSRFLSL